MVAPVTEELFVTARANELIDPGLGIWTWEVAMYLFLGGVTAGIIIFAAVVALLNKDQEAPFASDRLALLAPIVLSLGMTTLFLDLEHKLFTFRFYTTFRVLSPMSWGAWILVVIYPVSLLQIFSTLRRGYPQIAATIDKLAAGRAVVDWCEQKRRQISVAAIPIGVGLGVYTAILLSAFSARPFWNTGVLAPLFLVSGLSTAAALVALLTRHHGERGWFTRIDIYLIIVELALVGLFIINLATGSAPQLQALDCCIMGGPYTFAFWVLFVGVGLLIPLLLEVLEIRGLGKPLALIAAVLVLFGGYTLRHVMMEVGQESTWTRYETQYNAELLDRLHD
jgi:formate-dependent nitrite reductase membrane component NrfD